MEKNDGNVNENIVTKRIGINTLGILLIVFGIILSIQMFVKTDLFRYILLLWPVIFVSLGIETLYYNNNKKINVKFDIGTTFCILTILFIAFVFGILNFGLNQVLYNNDTKEFISESLDRPNIYYFDKDNLTISNYTDKNVAIKVIENSSENYTKATINLKYVDKYKNNLIFAMSNLNLENNILSVGNNSIEVLKYDSYIENIEIIVSIKDKNNLHINGNFTKE